MLNVWNLYQSEVNVMFSRFASFIEVCGGLGYRDTARVLGCKLDAERYEAMRRAVIETCGRELWDGGWYLRGITADGRKIGTHTDAEGWVYLESNAWAVLSGAADRERWMLAMEAVDGALYTEYGL